MTWFQIWTISWQVAVFLTPIMLSCAVLWLRAQFVTKVDAVTERNRIDSLIDGLKLTIATEMARLALQRDADEKERNQRYELLKDGKADHESRIRVLEADMAKPPTRHALNNELTKVVASNAGLERAVSGLGRQIDTVHNYMHTLVERGMEK